MMLSGFKNTKHIKNSFFIAGCCLVTKKAIDDGAESPRDEIKSFLLHQRTIDGISRGLFSPSLLRSYSKIRKSTETMNQNLHHQFHVGGMFSSAHLFTTHSMMMFQLRKEMK